MSLFQASISFIFSTELSHLAHHGIALASSSLTISENANIVTWKTKIFVTANKRTQRGVQYTYLQKRAAASRHRDLCRLDLARGSQASQAGEGVRITIIMMMIMMISGNDDDNDDEDDYGVQY